LKHHDTSTFTEGEKMPEKLKTLIQSRRFWAAVAAVVVVAGKHVFGEDVIDSETMTAIVIAIGSWIVGTSLRRTGGEP